MLLVRVRADFGECRLSTLTASVEIPSSSEGEEYRGGRHILSWVKRWSGCATLFIFLLFTALMTTAVAAQDTLRSSQDKTASGSSGSNAKLHTTSDEPSPTLRQSARQPRVTGIQHWSTDDHTRVAINLESDVAFASQRIPGPDRIVFDLRDTKLAATLVGRNFEVNDGFLKRIRVAQFQPERTRIVLEVHDLTDYDAFLLPNPHQLVIDIHRKEAQGRNALARPLKEGIDPPVNTEGAPQSGSGADSNADAEGIKSHIPNQAGRLADPRVEVSAGVQASSMEQATKSGPSSNLMQSGSENEDPTRVRAVELNVSVGDGKARSAGVSEGPSHDHASGAIRDGQDLSDTHTQLQETSTVEPRQRVTENIGPARQKTEPGVGENPSRKVQPSVAPISVSSNSSHVQPTSLPPAANENGNPLEPGPQPTITGSEFSHPDRVLQGQNSLPVPEDYVIGEQDLLTVTIWKERDLSGSVVVRPDGKITVPLVGEIRVIGMKPAELQSVLTERLKPFINVPQVTVAVNQINSRKVYLIGQVVKEGTFQINGSTTVLQIIAEAGGLRDFAKRKNIYVLRERGEQQRRYPFNYEAVIRGRNREQNIRLEPGDTVVVP